MKQFDYIKRQPDDGKVGVGVIVLQTDETLEPELKVLLPEWIDVFHTRIPSGAEVTQKTLAAMEDEIPKAANLLPIESDLKVVAYACTSGATIIGETTVSEAVRSVLPGVQVTNPLSAVKAKLNALGAHRIGLLTPYVPEVSSAMIDHLHDEGFEIVSSGSFFEIEERNVVRISAESITEALLDIGQTECDALFASCTNLPTAKLLDAVSKELKKPVISSNSALAWHLETLAHPGKF